MHALYFAITIFVGEFSYLEHLKQHCKIKKKMFSLKNCIIIKSVYLMCRIDIALMFDPCHDFERDDWQSKILSAKRWMGDWKRQKMPFVGER